MRNLPQNQNHGLKISRLTRASKRFQEPTKSETFHKIRIMALKSQNNQKAPKAYKTRNLDSRMLTTKPKLPTLQNQKHIWPVCLMLKGIFSRVYFKYLHSSRRKAILWVGMGLGCEIASFWFGRQGSWRGQCEKIGTKMY